MYLLVLVLQSGFMLSLPAQYPTQASCIAAGKAWEKEAPALGPRYLFACIPAPQR